MGTRSIWLPPEIERYIDDKVASGEFADAGDVVREALRLMMREEAEKLEWLRNAIAEGIASGDLGELSDGPHVIERVKRRGVERLVRERSGDAV
jgi:antitoxin ParD1/3/4